MPELLDIPEFQEVQEEQVGALFFDPTKYNNINCGAFWRQGINNSHCFWEYVVEPVLGNGTWTGYFMSDTEGGEHHVLFGCAMTGAGLFNFTGNLNGPAEGSFSSPQTFPVGQAYHVAVGWDGTDIMLWVQGFLDSVVAWSGPRKNDGNNNGCLHIGGSDHLMFWGYIEQVRGFEGYGRCCYDTDFNPERHFRPHMVGPGLTHDLPQFQHNYQTNASIFLDSSAGFEGVMHHGVKSAQTTAIIAQEKAPSFNEFELPVFVPGERAMGVVVPTPPATPSGALVWDSFSRIDCTPLTTDLLNSTITHSIEAGTLAPLDWVSANPGPFPNAILGILNGRAVMSNLNTSQLLATGTRHVDIRVDRMNYTECYTSILFRYKDDNDWYAVWGNEDGLNLQKHEGGVVTNTAVSVTAGWITLRIVANGTSLNIYTGTATEGTFTLQGSYTITDLPTATNHGLYNCTEAKLVYRADNFLIKAA